MTSTKTAIRFAALARVSTERQQREGESLHTQRSQIESDVARLGGTIVAWFGGQEHATPGHEKKELDRLLSDAAKKRFDAVIVNNADRWSRDNGKSKDGIRIFKEHAIRFFVGTSEYDLFNPTHCLFLGMSAEIGEFLAANQVKKSIDNRIERAKKGRPACGRLPFGRTYDKATGRWGVNEQKKVMIGEVARRYLAGEALADLAAEIHLNHSTLHKVLTRRSGTNWEQEFRSDRLNVYEVVQTEVPPLLPEKTIRAILRQAEANKTFHHGSAKHQYLLGRMVFCTHCGYAMFGQTNPNGHRYYRHAHAKRVHACPLPSGWVNADDLEKAVVRALFDVFGNPVAVQKAIEEATPNREKIIEDRSRLDRIVTELQKITSARDRIIRFISKGSICEGDATKELDRLKKAEARNHAELERLRSCLENVPSPEAIKDLAERVSSSFGKSPRTDGGLWAKKQTINGNLDAMTWDEKRALAEMVFGGKSADGKRMGVYVELAPGQGGRRKKRWLFKIIGHFTHDSLGGWIPSLTVGMKNSVAGAFRRSFWKK